MKTGTNVCHLELSRCRILSRDTGFFYSHRGTRRRSDLLQGFINTFTSFTATSAPSGPTPSQQPPSAPPVYGEDRHRQWFSAPAALPGPARETPSWRNPGGAWLVAGLASQSAKAPRRRLGSGGSVQGSVCGHITGTYGAESAPEKCIKINKVDTLGAWARVFQIAHAYSCYRYLLIIISTVFS